MEIFTLPFMQKAFLAGGLVGVVLPYLGVFATLKRMSFFGDGIAHASLAGVAIGVASGFTPFGMALVIGVLFGAGIYFLERKTILSSDAVIGIFFTTGLALGVILLSLEKGYQPELLGFLFGNILTISEADIFLISIFSALIFLFLAIFKRQLALMAFDRESAWISGINTGALEFTFYIILSVAVVLGVKLLGIILISALLVMPATTAKLVAKSFNSLILIAIIAGEIAIVFGLVFSYILDLPSGATIILTGTVVFLIVFSFNEILSRIRS